MFINQNDVKKARKGRGGTKNHCGRLVNTAASKLKVPKTAARHRNTFQQQQQQQLQPGMRVKFKNKLKLKK
jgi:hypothetical protein